MAWRIVRHCRSPEEAQAEACLEAVRLAAEWIRQPICLESDCATIVKALNPKESSRSCWSAGLFCRLSRSVISSYQSATSPIPDVKANKQRTNWLRG
jgi:hypothetical protein